MIVSSFIGLKVSFIPMRVLLDVVQLSPLIRIISVIEFGNHPNPSKVLLGESLPPLIFSRIVRPSSGGSFDSSFFLSFPLLQNLILILFFFYAGGNCK